MPGQGERLVLLQTLWGRMSGSTPHLDETPLDRGRHSSDIAYFQSATSTFESGSEAHGAWTLDPGPWATVRGARSVECGVWSVMGAAWIKAFGPPIFASLTLNQGPLALDPWPGSDGRGP